MQASDRRVQIELRVRYSETDQMGVVYHANYLPWCEVARTELIRRRGPSYARMEAEGVFLAVSEANLRYHGSARYDDLIRVECWADEVRSRAVTFSYVISRANPDEPPERLVTARTTLVALGDDGRPKKLPPAIIESLRNA
jgi:acyl-CoA thioester hydrolase